MKRKISGFMKENGGFLAVIVWACLAGTTISLAFMEVSIYARVIAVAVTILFSVLLARHATKSIDKDNAKKSKEKQELLEKLKKRYTSYISLVETEAKKCEQIVKKRIATDEISIKEEDVSLKNDYKYLLTFEQYRKSICENRIKGTPDTFILASCLIYALMKNPVIKIEGACKAAEVSVSLEVAMNCALELISEPSTYYDDGKGNWIEEKHPKVEINIPKGIIRDDDLSSRIETTIFHSWAFGKDIPIMQTSNLLHLIYLYCQKNS